MSTSRLDLYSNSWHLHAGKFTLAQNQFCLTLYKAPLEQLFEWYHELFCSLCCFSLVHALNNSTVQFFYHVVDSMWSFFLVFLLLCALDTPLGNQALFSTPVRLNSPPPLLRNVSRTPPNCLVSLSYLTPQCWAFLLFNHSPPLITSSSCPLNVQKKN